MSIELATLIAYFALMLYLGKVFGKANRNLSDYVRGGSQATWWLAGASLLMSNTSAFTFTGNASAAFEAGPSVLVIYAANVAALALSGWFVGARLRNTRAFTPADILRERFSPAVEQFYSYSGLFLGPLAAAIQLWALSVFASATFGIAIHWCIIGIGLVVVIYSTSGGKWAVMATDFVQGVILFGITTLIAILCLVEVGGPVAFFGYFSDPRFAADFSLVKPEGAFANDNFTSTWMIAIFLMTFYHQVGINGADRFLAVKDGREASRSGWFSAVLMLFGTVVWFLPPMVARFLHGDEILALPVNNPSEASYSHIARMVLPNGLMGVFIAAMFSATMSSMDTGLNRQVGIFARNIVPVFRRWSGHPEPLAPRSEVLLCKVMTILIGALVIGQSLLFAFHKDIVLFEAYMLINSYIGIPMLFPLLVGFWIKRIPAWSYFAIFGISAIPSVASFVDLRLHGTGWSIQDRTLWVLGFGCIGTLVTMPFYRRSPADYRERVDAFFRKLVTPVDFATEVGESRSAWQLRLLGRSTLGMGVACLAFVLVPNDLAGRTGALFVASFAIVIGLLMLAAERAERRREAGEPGPGDVA